MRTVVMVGSVFGFFCLLGSFFMPGAPQQAALAAMACAFCVIPYVAWKAGKADDEDRETRKFRADLLAILKETQDAK